MNALLEFGGLFLFLWSPCPVVGTPRYLCRCLISLFSGFSPCWKLEQRARSNQHMCSRQIPLLRAMLCPSPDDLLETKELKRFLRGQLVARFGREDAVQHSFERRVGALDNIYFAATALDPRSMFSVGEGNYDTTWRRGAAYLRRHFVRLHGNHGIIQPGAPAPSAVQDTNATHGLAGMDLPTLAPARRPGPRRLGWEHWNFSHKLQDLARSTQDSYVVKALAYRKTLSEEDAQKDVPVSVIYPNPVEFWVTERDNSVEGSVFRDLFDSAMAVLAVPATEASSERVFKAAKYVVNADRPHLDPNRGEQQVIVRRAFQCHKATVQDVARKIRCIDRHGPKPNKGGT